MQPSCPKCHTTRRPNDSQCHGCHHEFEEEWVASGGFVNSFNDLVLALAMVVCGIGCFVAFINFAVLLFGVAFGSRSFSDRQLLEYPVSGLAAYAMTLVFYRVLTGSSKPV